MIARLVFRALRLTIVAGVITLQAGLAEAADIEFRNIEARGEKRVVTLSIGRIVIRDASVSKAEIEAASTKANTLLVLLQRLNARSVVVENLVLQKPDMGRAPDSSRGLPMYTALRIGRAEFGDIKAGTASQLTVRDAGIGRRNFGSAIAIKLAVAALSDVNLSPLTAAKLPEETQAEIGELDSPLDVLNLLDGALTELPQPAIGQADLTDLKWSVLYLGADFKPHDGSENARPVVVFQASKLLQKARPTASGVIATDIKASGVTIVPGDRLPSPFDLFIPQEIPMEIRLNLETSEKDGGDNTSILDVSAEKAGQLILSLSQRIERCNPAREICGTPRKGVRAISLDYTDAGYIDTVRAEIMTRSGLERQQLDADCNRAVTATPSPNAPPEAAEAQERLAASLNALLCRDARSFSFAMRVKNENGRAMSLEALPQLLGIWPRNMVLERAEAK